MYFLYLIKYAILILLLIIASFKDIKTRTIPNRFVLYGLVAGMILVISGSTMPTVFDSFMGFLAGGGILLAISYVSKGGIGMGDVKLMACTGLYLGLGRVLGCMVIAIIFSGAFAAVMLITSGYDRKTAIPFAPFILTGVLTIFIQGFNT